MIPGLHGTPDQINKLFDAIEAVKGEIGFVHKEGHVNFGQTNYKYVGEAQLVRVLRPVTMEHGLTLLPFRATHVATSSKGEILHVTYLLRHKAGGMMEIDAIGQGQDKGDKAMPKAHTGGWKSLVRQLFMLETGDDPDRDASGKTAEEIARHEAIEARLAQVDALGYDVKHVDLFFKSQKVSPIREMTDSTYTGIIKRLKTDEVRQKVADFIESRTAKQDSTSRASDAMG